jgi:hypothetical protein
MFLVTTLGIRLYFYFSPFIGAEIDAYGVTDRYSTEGNYPKPLVLEFPN